LVLASSFVALSGCSFVDDFGRFEVADGAVADSGADTGSDADTGAPPPTDSGAMDSGPADTGTPDTGPTLPACATAFLVPGVEAAADTSTATDDYAGSCGGAGGKDVVYAFVAPADGYYLFETIGSSFDTVLYLYDACDGLTELGCNVDGPTAPQSQVPYLMTAGEMVIVVGDGNAAASGDLRVTAGPVACPDADLVPAILPLETTTVGRPDEHTSACGGTGAGDRGLRYTATTTGFHRFTMTSETTGFDPLLSVERGPLCGGEVVQCNASGDGVAEVTRYLTDGEVLTLRADGRSSGHEGDYRLEVTELPALGCDTTLVEGSGPINGTLAIDDPHQHSGSCGEAHHVASVAPRVSYENPDVAFLVTDIPTPPAPPCRFSCVLEVTADFPFILSVQETDTCNGNEIACAASTSSGAPFSGSVELMNIEPATGNAIIVLDRQLEDQDVSGISVPWGNNYTVDYFCFGVC